MEIQKEATIATVTMVNRFDSGNAKEVESELRKLIRGSVTHVICDFSKNTYISSAGFRVLLAVAKILQETKGEIILCSLTDYVKEVFEIAGFMGIFKVFASLSEARGYLARQSS